MLTYHRVVPVTAAGQPKQVSISIDYNAAFGDATLNGRAGYVVLHDARIGNFVVPVRRLLRIIALANERLHEVGKDTALAAVGSYDNRSVWVLSTVSLADRMGSERHAA